jgi:hypothetical protein
MVTEFIECRKCSGRAISQKSSEVCTNRKCRFVYSQHIFGTVEENVLIHEAIKRYLEMDRLFTNNRV